MRFASRFFPCSRARTSARPSRDDACAGRGRRRAGRRGRSRPRRACGCRVRGRRGRRRRRRLRRGEPREVRDDLAPGARSAAGRARSSHGRRRPGPRRAARAASGRRGRARRRAPTHSARLLTACSAALVGLDRDDARRGAEAVRDGRREQADAAVEVEVLGGGVEQPRVDRVLHRRREHRGRRAVHLPEPGVVEAEGAAVDGLGDRGRLLLSTTRRTPPPDAITSTVPTPSKRSPSAGPSISRTASGSPATGTTRCERAANGPGRPSASTCSRTRVRQPSPPAPSSPGAASTSASRSIPPKRRSASCSTSAFSARWRGRAMWPSSAPPARSAGSRSSAASAQTWGTRSGLASSASTATARQKDALRSSVTATTRSPGIASATKTTRPSWRATPRPPCAKPVTSSSSSAPAFVPTVKHRSRMPAAPTRLILASTSPRGCGCCGWSASTQVVAPRWTRRRSRPRPTTRTRRASSSGSPRRRRRRCCRGSPGAGGSCSPATRCSCSTARCSASPWSPRSPRRAGGRCAAARASSSRATGSSTTGTAPRASASTPSRARTCPSPPT